MRGGGASGRQGPVTMPCEPSLRASRRFVSGCSFEFPENCQSSSAYINFGGLDFNKLTDASLYHGGLEGVRRLIGDSLVASRRIEERGYASQFNRAGQTHRVTCTDEYRPGPSAIDPSVAPGGVRRNFNYTGVRYYGQMVDLLHDMVNVGVDRTASSRCFEAPRVTSTCGTRPTR